MGARKNFRTKTEARLSIAANVPSDPQRIVKPMNRWFQWVRRISIAAAITLALSSCAATVPDTDIVRVAIRGPLTTLDPLLVFSYEANSVDEAIFDGLVKIDPRGDVVPDLARVVPSVRNGGISPDGRTITYHLRRAVRWQDGAPFTSADVAFTFDLLRDPHINGPNRAIYGLVSSLQTPDRYTVRVHLLRPYAAAVARLFCIGENGAIVPRHLLQHSRDINRDDFNVHPIGTGPYELVSWARGSSLDLRANPAYFEGSPHIKELELLEVPDDSTLLSLLRTHEIDVATIPPSLIPAVRHDSAVRIIAASTRTAIYLAFNLTRSPFDDRRVRTALALGLDRHRIARVVSLGTARAADSLISPMSWAYAPKNAAPAYDVMRANELLDASGWRRGTHGMRSKNGQPLAIGLVTFQAPAVRAMAVLIQDAWRNLGARVSVRFVSGNMLYGDGLLSKGRYDVALLGQGFDADPDLTEFITGRYVPPLGDNFARYRDADIDRWSDAALRTSNRPARTVLYARIIRRLNQDLPYIPIAWPSTIYAVNTRLRGFKPETLNSDFWNVANWRM